MINGSNVFSDLRKLNEGYEHIKLGWFEGHLYSVTKYDDGTICIQGAFPYDDAEHYWARHIDGDNGFTIYYRGRYKKFPSMNYEEVAAELARYNKLVKPIMVHESIDEEVEEAIVSADNFTTEPRHIKKAFGKWSIPDDDGDGDVDYDDFMAFMKAHYSTPGLDSSNWTDDMWETARSFYNESLTEADEETAKEKVKNFDVSKAKEGIKKCANTAKNLINNNEKLNQFLDKAEAFLSKSSSKELRKAATIISMIRDYASGAYTEIPMNAIIGLVAALVYMVVPVDIIPDVIPVAGMVDDIGVVMVAIKSFDKDIDNYNAWKKNKGKVKTESLEEATGPIKAPDEFDEYYESISEEDLEDLIGFPADEYPCENVPGYDCKHICWLYARPEYEDALANNGLEFAELVSEEGGTPFVAQVIHDRIIPVSLDEIESCIY